MKKIYFKIIKIVFAFLILQSCTVEKSQDLHSIIENNVKIYQNNKNIDFENIAAIMKNYSHLMNKEKINSIEEIRRFSNSFVTLLKSENISKNYPVKANNKETLFFERLINQILIYLEQEKIENHLYPFYITKTFNYILEESYQ